MGLFSRDKPKPVKRLSKLKQLERRIDSDDDQGDDYPDDHTDDSRGTDTMSTSGYVAEFKEGIDEITELFLNDDESGGDKFAKLSFGLANLCNYRNTVFDGLVGGGMSESRADVKLKSILVDAGFHDMMMEIISFREPEKKRGRKKKVN